MRRAANPSRVPLLCLLLLVATAGCADEGEAGIQAEGTGIVVPWLVLAGLGALVVALVRRRR